MSASDDLDSLTRRLVDFYRAGAIDDAFAIGSEAVRLYPNSTMAWTNLGLVHLRRNEPGEARRCYERALELNAGNDEARRGLAVAKHYAGEAAVGNSVSIAPERATTDNAVHVLALVSVREGNIVTEALFDDASMHITRVAVELHPLDEPLPPHDVAFNILGDVDVSRTMLERAEHLLRSSPVVLNPPDAVMRTGRADMAERLRSIPNVVTPRVALLRREAVAQSVNAFPVLLRSPGFHNGQHFEFVADAGALEEVLGRLPGGDIFVMDYIDTRERTGHFAKYRVMTIGGTLYPLHLAISNHWKVHYVTSQTPADASFRERERAFLEHMEQALGSRAIETLQQISRIMALDYGGIDFGLDRDGRVVVFEANATMAIRYPAVGEDEGYRTIAVDRAIDAVREMLRSNRASA